MKIDFLTIEQQISLLKKRGMSIPNREYATKLLSNNSYYNLINGYASPFLFINNPKKYLRGTTLSEIFALYDFDSKLRHLLLTYLLDIENQIKAKTVNAFLSKTDINGEYIHTKDDYLKAESFDLTSPKQIKNVKNLINSLNTLIDQSKDSDPFKHYLDKYNYIPLFVLATRASFGQLSKFYSSMLLAEREKVSKTYNLTDLELRNILGILTQIRNNAAHGNRLYCFVGKKVIPILNNYTWANQFLEKNRQYSKFDSVIISLKIMLAPRKYNAFKNALLNELDNLSKKLKTISINDIYKYMNLYHGWEKDL